MPTYSGGGGGQAPPPKKPKKPPHQGGHGHGKGYDPFGGDAGYKPGAPPPVKRAQRKARRQQQRAAKWLNRHSNRGQAVKRRQTILRSAGYRIAVDGVWGPQSQHAWQSFTSRRAAGDKALGAPFAVPKGQIQKQRSAAAAQADSYLAASRQHAAQARQAAAAALAAVKDKQHTGITVAAKHEQAKQAEQAAVIKQRADIKRVADTIRTDPNAASTLTLRQLTDALVDPQVGVDVTSHAGALAVQNWLNHHGYHVERSGAYNKATHDTLMHALRDEQHRIRVQQNDAVVNQLYAPNHLHAGDDKPDWLAELPGKDVPRPEQLVALLQHGGFAASVVYRQLLTHSKDANWTNFQHDRLLDIAAKIQPFATGIRGFGSPTNDFLYTQLALSIPQTSLSPYGHGYRYGDRQEAKRQADLVAQVTALYKARGAADFKSKLSAYTAVEEQKALREEQQRAAHSVGFFGNALHYIVAPGQFMRTAMVVDTHLLLGTLDPSGRGPGLLDYVRMSDDQRAAIWQRGVDAQEHANPVLNFTYQLFADPLWLAKPFKVGSSLVRYAGDSGILGSRAALATAKLGKYAFEGDSLIGKSYTYEAGTWTKTGILGATSRALLPEGVHAKAADVAGRSLSLKSEALDAARARVGLAMRHGFQKPHDAFAAGIEHFAPDAKLSKRLADSIINLKALHDADPSGDLQSIVGVLADHEVSLYMDAGRQTYSQVGASLVARASEAYRVHVARRIAIESARDVLRVSNDRAAAIDEFRRVMRVIGSHAAGARTKDTATRILEDGRTETLVIHDALRKQVAARMDEFENTLVYAWQEILEERALQSGKQLFDEQGLWAGREGESVGRLQALASETFGKPVSIPNPLFTVGHTWAEASEAIEDEVRRLSSRALQYEERLTVGKLGSDFNVADKLAQVRKDVETSWHQAADGLWYDKRPDLEVSSLYARHIEEAVTGGKPIPRDGDLLTHLGAFPADVVASASSPLDTAIEHLTWRLGGRSKMLNFGARIHPADVSHLVGQLSDREVSFSDELAQAIAGHQDGLAQAYDLAMPQAMKSELALWQALAHAQSAPLHYLYRTINAGLSLWITATLPLRPAWVVRNVIDNFSKTLIAGIHDPRMFFLGAENPGSGIRTLFDFGVYPLRQATYFLDQLFGTDVLAHFDALLAHFWELPASILRRVFSAHGIEVPESHLEEIKQDYVPGKARVGGRPHVAGEEGQTDSFLKTKRDALYQLMGNRPENYFKRVIYRDTVAAETKRLRLSPEYLNNKALEQPFTVKINDGEVQRLLRKYTGSGADEISVVFKRVPREVITKTERRYGYFRMLSHSDVAEAEQSLADLGITDQKITKNYLVVYVPDDVKITGHQEAQDIADHLSKVFAHELRHGVQVGRLSGGLDRAVSKRFPQALQARYTTMEIDARVWASLRRKLGRDIFHIDPNLPSMYDDARIAREAHDIALKKIEDTLFDYSKVTVLEDNLRVFFPFIQFWRKNLGFWTTHSLDKPWLVAAYAKWEQDMNDAHSDLPQWMRRYLSSDELIDAAAVVPGLDKVVSAIIPANAQYDPVKFSSVAPIYRSFLSLVGAEDNANLPPGEGNGWPIIGPMLDAMNQWGLGSNPLIEKPLEVAGVASDKSWQTVFPQAGPIIALDPGFWLQHSSNRLVDWTRIAALTALGADANGIAKNMDYYINAEIAGQVARGEKPDRAKATKLIQDWFFTQNMVGYFTGMYLRRATQQDVYLSKLYDAATTGERKKFTDREQELLKLWAMRGADRYSYDRYLQAVPSIKAYYKQPDFASAQDYLDQHPELTQYVDPTWRGQPFSHNWVKQATLRYAADTFFRVSQLSDTLDVAHDVKQYAQSLLLTPEIQKMWAERRTPAQRQRRMLEGLIHEQIDRVNNAYFSIPASNDAARRDFLNQHPELIRLWNANNNAADDYESILHDANAELRQRFFDLIHQGKHHEADAFLAQHAFLWEDTHHADHFDPKTGQLKLQYMSAKARAYMDAKPAFDKLDRLIEKVGKKAAWNWLYNSDDPDAKAARDYIKQYGKHGGRARSQHAIDYLAVRSILKAYFNMPKDVRDDWLRGDTPEAKQLRAYFDKWANPKGHTQHASDYLAAKGALDHYFSLSKSARRAWLKAGSPDAQKVLDYFKKYGTVHKYERAFAKIEAVGGTPEQRQRILFWKHYFALTPDKRPQFIHDHAEDYGVFVYGPLSQTAEDERQQAWLRRAHGSHLSHKQLDYLFVKPLLDFYFTLKSGGDKRLFLEANPELESWFAAHPPHVHTGSPKLDAEVQAYFKLDMSLRSSYIADHPELQKWFDSKGTPADRAIHSLLSQYFALAGAAKSQFAAEHPEIGAFFAARLLEQANISATAQALYEADPRLTPYRNNVTDMIASANRQAERLRAQAENSFTPDTIEANRDRTLKYTGHSTGRHRQKKPKADIGTLRPA